MRRVKAYFALKLAGDDPDAPHMAQARDTVHRLGGLEHTNSYVRFYLALVGAVGWEMVPAIPPELMLLPNWFYMNIYEMSSWTRGIVIPWRFFTRCGRIGACRSALAWTNCSGSLAERRRHSRGSKQLLSLAKLFPGAGPRAETLRKAAVEAAAAARAASEARSNGCWSTWSAPRGWRRFIRR